MGLPHPEFAQLCTSFARLAIDIALETSHTFGIKSERNTEEHLGSADIANTALAEQLFLSTGLFVVIEEKLPPFSSWDASKPVIFVDPVDGSAEAGTGGCQIAAAVSLYGANGVPIYSAAASPGIRPVFRTSSTSFDGFSKTVGTILFGGPDAVYLLPLYGNRDIAPIRVPSTLPLLPTDAKYSSIALDLNFPAPCGLRKGFSAINTGIVRMPFSNIFCQMQAILGQTNAMTFGPTNMPPIENSWRRKPSCVPTSGPKAWDFIMPLAAGVGLEYRSLDGRPFTSLMPTSFVDGYIMRNRLILSHPAVWDAYAAEIVAILQI
jgi:hypothetical protein